MSSNPAEGAPVTGAGVVGRDREIAAVAAFLDAVPSGPCGLLLEGAAGIGKRTVWSAGVALAAERSYTVVSCRPAEVEAAPAAWAWPGRQTVVLSGPLEVTAMPDTATMGPLAVVTFPAEIDMATAGALGEQVAAALAPGVQAVIADMAATTFCDSAGITMLIRAKKQATARGAELRLLLPDPNVLRVLKIQGVDAVLPIYHSLDEALAGAGQREPATDHLQ
jgi:anti-sigma B factor antagonist